MRSPLTSTRATVLAAIVAVVVGGVLWRLRSTPDEVRAGAQPAPQRSAPAALAAAVPAPDPGSAGPVAADPAESIAGAAPYPVDLNALRARLPDNRFWQLGAPTSDPAVAKQRAARAERDNAALGRVVSGEASADEVRAYYAERRAISRDYLQLAEIVLAEKGEALPPRDRGAFELSANLHRARLQQIDRDEADALARRAPH